MHLSRPTRNEHCDVMTKLSRHKRTVTASSVLVLTRRVVMRAQVEEKLSEVLNSDEDKRRNEAAVKIQRRWRASQRNRFAADALSPDARWQQAAVHAKMKVRKEYERGDAEG